MIAIGFEVTGVPEVQAGLSSLPAVTTRLRGYMTGAANALRGMVQQNIASTFHSSGPLAQGVRSDISEDSGGVTARIAIENVPYARIQEQGGTVQIPELAPVNTKVLAFSTPARGAVAAIAARGASTIFAMHTKAHPVTIPAHPYARTALANYQQPSNPASAKSCVRRWATARDRRRKPALTPTERRCGHLEPWITEGSNLEAWHEKNLILIVINRSCSSFYDPRRCGERHRCR